MPWYRRSFAPFDFWSKVFGLMGYTFCLTSIAHHYSTPSTGTCPTNRHNHELFYRSRHWWTITPNCHCQWWHNYTANYLDIIFGTSIQETMGDSCLAHQQLCSMQATGNPESGIFGLRKGVMLRSLTISSYHLWTTFSFQCSILGYALSPPLPHLSITFLCHSALHHPCIPDIVTHSIYDSFLLLL